jgi:lysophospholipase L1-like esterase
MIRKTSLLLAFVSALFVSSLAAAPERWAAAIDAFTQADAAQPPARDAVLFVGSSSIVKWKTLAQDFPGVTLINRGFGGSELTDSVHFADRIVIPYRPRVVVIYAGENDLQLGQTPDSVYTAFTAFSTKVHAALPQARIVFISIKPSPSRWKLREAMIRANTLIAAACAKDKRLVFVNVFTPMLDARGEPRAELFVKDMLHLNDAGYALWTPLVAPLLK